MSVTEIKIFTMDHCPYCEKAKRLLTARGIKYTENKVSYDDDAEWDRLEKLSGLKTMPQIFKGETLIGGYSDLEKLDKEGGLKNWV